MYGKPAWNKGVKTPDEVKDRMVNTRKERGIPSSIKGRTAMHKGNETVYVLPEKVEEYLLMGYEPHGAKRNRKNVKEKNEC